VVKLFISRWINAVIAAALLILLHTIGIGENGIIPLAAMILALLNIQISPSRLGNLHVR
jgi:hypothetical protein